MTTWTAEQVEALAPDAASVTAGRRLSAPTPWSELGADDGAVWGLCKGSGKTPYQTQVDLAGPAFRCSCPSRKFPCKHAIGLLLLWANQPTLLTGARPPWVDEWLSGREERTTKAEKRAAARDTPPDPEAQAARAAARAAKVDNGLAELEVWLADLVRSGLAAAQSQPFSFFDAAAARLVDAQAPGLAARVRQLAATPSSGSVDWPARLLEQAALLHLVIEGYRRATDDPDLRSAVGFNVAQDTVRAGPAVRDRWHALGRVVTGIETGDRIASQRVWLWGEQTNRFALSLSFAPPGQVFDATFAVGTTTDASLAFYPGANAWRTLVLEQHGDPEPTVRPHGDATFTAALARVSTDLATNPLIDRHPLLVDDVVLQHRDGRFEALDVEGNGVTIDVPDDSAWVLHAVAGGRPATIFGEWTHRVLRVLSLTTTDRLVPA